MLFRNLNIGSGLVNGSIGIIRKLHETVYVLNDRTFKTIVKLTVQFEEKEFEIERTESKLQLKNNAFIVRKQNSMLGVCNNLL